MRLTNALLFFIVLFPLISKGQTNFTTYFPIASSGEIPEEFRMLYSDKFEEDKTILKDSDKRSERKAKESYILKSNYLIEQLIVSGRVLYNDPIGNYVNKVADELLKNDPELRKDLKIYVVKSPIVNAFTTNRGVIFVSLGLIAQLENESQLAYILAHESIHHKNKHGIEAYIEKDKIVKGKDKYKWHTQDDKILSLSSYSKELEFEADAEGLNLYLNTAYDLSSLNGVFDVLQYAYLPFDDVEFDTSFFATPYMKIPSSYYLEDENEIVGEEDEDDSRSTHPNVKRRRSTILAKIEAVSNDGKKKFIVSQTEFNEAREIARFELSKLYIMDQEYAKSIYNSYMLLKKHPNNLYLEKSIAKALYLLSKYKNEGLFSDVHEGYKDIEGSSQQLYHMLSKLSSLELNCIALHYAWKLKQKYPSDEYVKKISNDLMHELISRHNVTVNDFNQKPKEELKKEIVAQNDSSSTEEASKYEKIKKKKTTDKIEKEEKFISYVFVDLFSDLAFKDSFEYALEDYNEEKRKKELEANSEEESTKRKQEKLEKRKGKALGIDKIVVVDPYYIKIDERKEDQIQYISTATNQLNFSNTLEENAKLAHLEIDVLTPKTFGIHDEEKYNDLSVLNEWIDEQIKIDEDLESNVILFDSTYLDPVISHYNTDYFLWTGILTARLQNGFNSNKAYTLCVATVFYPLLPFVVYGMLKPRYETTYYTYLVNVSKSEVVLSNNKHFSSKDRNDLMNAFIYDNMSQIKNKRKEKKK